MTGTITTLVDNQQFGSIAGEDGHDYFFAASALRGVNFTQLSLGVTVSFTPVQTSKLRRAESVELRDKFAADPS
jgi:cold shock CspA family protein